MLPVDTVTCKIIESKCLLVRNGSLTQQLYIPALSGR